MTRLAEEFKDLNESKVYEIIDELLGQGASPIEIIKLCNEGLVQVGELFAKREYFLTELMFSAEIMKEVMKKLEPLIGNGNETKSAGTVVIGSVKGDIHDIGKNIVIALLKSNGFKIIDMGVDVPSEKFVEAVRENNARILGLSALLNSTYPEMKNVVNEIKEAGLKDQVKIVIGGTVCSEAVKEFTGADYYAIDAVAGVNICKKVYID